VTKTPFTPYHKRLFLLLSVATFFEGYDFMALTQILPELREEMGLLPSQGAYLIAVVNLGAIAAYLLVRKADVWGRRKVLTFTIAGYTLFTFLTAFSVNVWMFGTLQFLARVFLLAEWAVAMVYAAEEFPADRRGMVMGVIQAFSSLGAIVCAGVVPLLLETPYGWRSVYLVGIVPLFLVAYVRRNLKETTRFTKVSDAASERSFFDIMRGPYAKRVLAVGLIWFVTYCCTQNAVVFWKEFVVAERGFSAGDVGKAVALAAVVSMPLVFLSGKLLDVIGRKPGATLIFIVTSIGVFGAYTLGETLAPGSGPQAFWALTGALVLAVFGVSAVLPVLNAFTTELFPTDLRGDAYAWANNLIGRIGYVLAPVLVGFFADDLGWGAAVRPTAIFPLIALALIWWLLPETANKELEETARV
jgi:putative MFS transporter